MFLEDWREDLGTLLGPLGLMLGPFGRLSGITFELFEAILGSIWALWAHVGARTPARPPSVPRILERTLGEGGG